MQNHAVQRCWLVGIVSLGLTLVPGPWLVAPAVHAQTVTYTYDDGCTNGKGSLCAVSDATGGTTLAYDQRGNLTSATVTLTTGAPCPTATPCTIGRTYDSQNRLVRLTYPDGEQVLQFYNAQGMLERVCRTTDGSTCASGGDYVANLNYNALGQVTTRVLGSGTTYTTNYEYYRSGATTPCNSAAVGQRDTFRLCTVITAGQQDLTYTYDPAGNVTGMTDNIGTHLASQDFGYDPLNRLTSAGTKPGATPAYSHSYGYNAIGNLTSAAGQSYTYPLPGYPRPHAATSDGAATYCYDANGNLEKKISGTAAPCSTTGSTVRSFIWDADNRLAQIQDGTTTVAAFRYDAAGQRVQKMAGAATTTYVGALQQIVGNARTNYIFANGQRVAAHDLTANRVSYYLTDQLGSTSVFVDAPNPNQVLAYEPYGTVRAGGTAGVAHKFTGQELDEETGLYDYGARYYDPSLRRFISADSMGGNPANPQTLNRYAYVLNNPLRYTDPTGNVPCAGGIGDTCTVGGEPVVSGGPAPEIITYTGGSATSWHSIQPYSYVFTDLTQDNVRQLVDEIQLRLFTSGWGENFPALGKLGRTLGRTRLEGKIRVDTDQDLYDYVQKQYANTTPDYRQTMYEKMREYSAFASDGVIHLVRDKNVDRPAYNVMGLLMHEVGHVEHAHRYGIYSEQVAEYYRFFFEHYVLGMSDIRPYPDPVNGTTSILQRWGHGKPMPWGDTPLGWPQGQYVPNKNK